MNFRLLSVVMLLCLLTDLFSQDIISQNRRIDWQPGISGGIPDYTVEVNVMDYGAVGNGIDDDTQAFKDAVTACSEEHAVFIPAGTYLITDRINIQKSIVLRGAGPDQTFINFEKQQDASEYQRTNIWIGTSELGFTANILGNCNKGSSQITVNDVSGFMVGDMVEIRQDNDPEVMARPIVDPEVNDSWAEGHWGWRAVGQFLIITDIDGTNNRLTFHRPLYYTYNLSMNPKVTRCVNPTKYAGVEDLHCELVIDCNGYFGNIQFDHALYCWVKNIRSYKCSRSHIGIWGGLGNVIRDSYFEYGHQYVGGTGYGVNLVDRATDNLIENNIFDYLQGKLMTALGVCGNVYAYNYCRISMDENGPGTEMHADMSAHGHHAYLNLFEGNSTNKAAVDRYWGSNSGYVFLRNKMICPDGYSNSYTSKPVFIEKNNPYMSFIGNILHHENSVKNRIVWFVLEESDDWNDTSLTMNTLIRHGNFDYISESTFWDPEISDHNIPDSYYLTDKPEFFTSAPWGDTPWPVIRPDLLYSGIIPAQQHFCDLNGISPPASPSALTGQVLDNRVHLTWTDNSDDEHSFRIEQSTDGADFYRIESVMQDSTQFIVINLHPHSTYYFRVCAYSRIAGQSAYSNTVMNVTQDEPPDEMVAYYKFDGNAADSSGNDYHGDIDGAVLTTGKIGQAYLFDGIDDVIYVPGWNDSSLYGDKQAFTLAAWIQPHTLSDDNWVINDDSEWANFNFGLIKNRLSIKWIQSGNIRYSLLSVEYPVVKPDEFSHIAVTFDSYNKIVRMYLNGKQVVIDRVTGVTGPVLFNRLYIGRGSVNGQMKTFNGIIDDIRIYTSCLSGEKISEMYSSAVSGLENMKDRKDTDIPENYILSQNYPNPFNPTTTISYTVGAQNIVPQHVELSIYNTLGQKVAMLVNKKQPAGNYKIKWDASGFKSGLYFYRLKSDRYQDVRKMILLK